MDGSGEASQQWQQHKREAPSSEPVNQWFWDGKGRVVFTNNDRMPMILWDYQGIEATKMGFKIFQPEGFTVLQDLR